MLKILLVEDNQADVALSQAALEQGKLSLEMTVADNGEHALELLKTGFLPDLILLDLNMPKMDGRELLTIIKNDIQFKSIPVVILTSSSDVADIESTYIQHANCYIQKPVDFDSFIDIVNSISGFWFTVVKLPNGDHQ